MSLNLTVKEKDVSITHFDTDTIVISIAQENAVIELTGNTMLKTTGDFHILSDGEMSFASKNGMYLDTIDSKLHLNSRKSKILKDTNEAKNHMTKIYFDQTKKLLEKSREKSETIEQLFDKMNKRIEELEKRTVSLVRFGGLR